MGEITEAAEPAEIGVVFEAAYQRVGVGQIQDEGPDIGPPESPE